MAAGAAAQNVQAALVQSGQVLYVPVDSDTFKPILPGEAVEGPVYAVVNKKGGKQEYKKLK